MPPFLPCSWDHEDREKRKAMVFDPRTLDALARSLQRAHDSLVDSGMAGDARFYEAGQLGWFCKKALTGVGDTLLRSLLFVEAEIIAQAQKAGLAIAKFREEGLEGPAIGGEGFGRFWFGRSPRRLTRRSGACMAAGLCGRWGPCCLWRRRGRSQRDAANAKPAALFELTVVRQTARFDLAKFVIRGASSAASEDIVIQERLVAV